MPMPWPRPGPDRVSGSRTARSSPVTMRMRRSRMLGWDRNPLRRRINRVEAAMVCGLIAVFLISAPMLAAVAGHRTGSASMQEQRAGVAWRLVPATVQSQIPSGPADMSARWTAPDGQARSGWIPVSLADAPGGSTGVGHQGGLADWTAAPAFAGTSTYRHGRMADSARAGTSSLLRRRRRAGPARPASAR